jgi:response regulator NasT
MENLMLSEDEAHKKIERTAMDSRKTRLEIAEKIIKEYSEPA